MHFTAAHLVIANVHLLRVSVGCCNVFVAMLLVASCLLQCCWLFLGCCNVATDTQHKCNAGRVVMLVDSTYLLNLRHVEARPHGSFLQHATCNMQQQHVTCNLQHTLYTMP